MGCGASKVDDLPLVVRCRERKQLIKAANEQRFDLAIAHISYFRSLKDVGDALCKFVDEELVIGVDSPPDSPVLTLPSEGKKKKKKDKDIKGSPSTSISYLEEEEGEDSHLHLSSEDSHLHLSSGSDSELESGHIHIEESPQPVKNPYVDSPPLNWGYPGTNTVENPYIDPSSMNWGYSTTNTYTYYMKKSSTPVQSVVYEDPERSTVTEHWQGQDPSYSYPGYPTYGDGDYYGFPGFQTTSTSSPYRDPYYNRKPSPPAAPPSPPSPKVSAWDFLNPFDSYDNFYPSYYPRSRYVHGSTASSPDSKEVREREGIPDLEDDTEPEVVKEVYKGKSVKEDHPKSLVPGSSRAVSAPYVETSSRAVPSQNSEPVMPAKGKDKEVKSSPDSIESKSIGEEYVKKKGVSFEVEEASVRDVESLMPSSLTALSTSGTRDLQEVVKEIKNEFETASGYGRELAVMLEVGKLPYQPRGTVLKVIFSGIRYMVAPASSSHLPTRRSIQEDSGLMKMANDYCGGSAKDIGVKPINLSATLEKLYVWEKKLYKEVKDEERLRVIYEKKCKRLKVLDDRGAESSKIDATQSSVKKLLTKINVAIRAVDAISSQIHKLRDEELQPQITELINGLIRMWKSMLKCHQKQFQAIMESKTRTLKARTGHRRDSNLRATMQLELELLNWSKHFTNWINTQKEYVEALNGWLQRCLAVEPEVTPDGVAPFSPGRIGAPLIFVICNDWYQAMERVSKIEVADVMNNFALTLHQLLERQKEEERQRLKAEYLSKDFEQQLRVLRREMGRIEHDQDALSEKTAKSALSGSGVSPLDDLKVDLDSIRSKLDEERSRHKEAVKQVHDAASSGLHIGLVPIFKALENFTAEALKAYEQVRVQNPAAGS
ncbi:protein of unknown function DUF632 [Dillenia turbinata]|uniref:DUF632 domain-containing protein n=1 Tax=Dillenia turbinata TaxID=194707 RepID=A0AAN8VV93_9MAGN